MSAEPPGSAAPLTESQRRLLEQRLHRRPASRVGPADAIPRRASRSPRHASPGERWIFLAHQSGPSPESFNITSSFLVRGRLDPARLEGAVARVVSRHEILRTSFQWTTGAVEATVHTEVSVPVQHHTAEHADDLEQRAQAMARAPFDLGRAPLLRLHYFGRPGGDGLLMLVVHDIVFDKWSLGLFWKEVAAFYREAGGGAPAAFPDLAVQYGDFAAWQSESLKSGQLASQLQYWSRALANLDEPLALPTDRPYPSRLTDAGRLERRRIEPALTERLKALAVAEDVSLFMLLLAGFQVLLHRYTSATDLVVGSPVANRRRETADLIGFFLSTVAHRTVIGPATTARSLLRQVRATVLDALQHQDVPFDRVVEAVKPPRRPGRHPVCQTMFVYQRESEAAPGFDLDDVALRHVYIETLTSKFDVTLFAAESGDGMETILEYRTDLFDRDTAQRMLRHYGQLLESIARDPDARVSELNLLTGDEQRAFFLDWQGNDSPVDERTHALARMNEAAAVSPHHPAVVGGGATLTRETLARSAGAIAHALRRLGLDAGARVGLVMDRTPTAIAAMLGILEAGYAYVPLDPEYPEERTRFVIGHAGIRVAVTTGELRSKVASLVSEVIVCEHRLPATTPVDTLPSIQPQQIAYVIYTSGSTGRPKGVPVSHHNLHVSTEARFQYYRDTPERFLLVPSLSFDSSVAGIFWTLAAGGTLVMASQEDVSDPRRLASLIREHRVTDLLCIPALYRELLRHSGPDLGSLRRVIVAGEPCPPRLVGLHLHAMPGVALFNEYGPTEATVWATVHLCTAADASAARVPIGRPIPRAGAFVLDACQQPLPVGVPGELYLAGGGLAAGYLEDPQQTQQRFLTRALPVIGATRLYRTGDRARWRRDGVLELMGRTDDQIKLRGYRIEPGEIAAALEEHPDVDRAIVMAASHRSPDSGHDDLSQMLSGLPPADIEAFVVDAESYPAEDSSRVRDDGQERVPDEPTRVVSRDRFRLALRSDAGFVSTPREAQRNWLLGRALEEFAGDLEHLDRLAATLVSGYDHHLDRDLHDVSRQALTDQQIMEDWQTPLMRAMAGHVTSSHGHVLEIGFGRGVSAEMIQHFGVASHTIVEPNDHSVRRYFEPWRRRHADRNISLLRARWQDVDERLGLFDGVFFHAFPMNEREFSEYVLRSVTFAEHAFGPMAAHLRDGGVFTYLTTEIDSLGRGHQRSLLRHFRSFSVHVEPLAVPEDTRDSWWAQTMVVVKAVK